MRNADRFLVPLLALAVLLPAPSLRGEPEPNEGPDQAVSLAFDSPLRGVWHFGDGHDYFRLDVPGPGVVTVEVGGYPKECAFQVVAVGFDGKSRSCVGFEDGKPGEALRVEITSKGGDGFLGLRLRNVVSAFSTDGYGLVKCAREGPWHVTPYREEGRTPKGVPAAVEGALVDGPVAYTLVARFQPGAGPAAQWPAMRLLAGVPLAAPGSASPLPDAVPVPAPSPDEGAPAVAPPKPEGEP